MRETALSEIKVEKDLKTLSARSPFQRTRKSTSKGNRGVKVGKPNRGNRERCPRKLLIVQQREKKGELCHLSRGADRERFLQTERANLRDGEEVVAVRRRPDLLLQEMRHRKRDAWLCREGGQKSKKGQEVRKKGTTHLGKERSAILERGAAADREGKVGRILTLNSRRQEGKLFQRGKKKKRSDSLEKKKTGALSRFFGLAKLEEGARHRR